MALEVVSCRKAVVGKMILVFEKRNDTTPKARLSLGLCSVAQLTIDRNYFEGSARTVELS